ncbi:MAG: segregation/condensation protein A [Cyclobacteriaceae bacterium]|nr:segregation/condensation protein A [Cyclobacteriaceae bacterium]
MNYEIKLPLFEGPFDLLLFFIERDELDIYDIPISKITQDFLSYVEELEKLNLEVASEFILVAATLMRIKAKLLLPRERLDELGQEIDPREELVRHLLEYKKYKSVIAELASLEEERALKEKRGNVLKELKKLSESTDVESELQDVDLYKLLKVYERVLVRFENEQKRPIHTIVPYPYTIADKKKEILSRLVDKSNISFEDIITKGLKDKVSVIFNFLAILELLQMQLIGITVGEGYNNFWIQKLDSTEEKALA